MKFVLNVLCCDCCMKIVPGHEGLEPFAETKSRQEDISEMESSKKKCFPNTTFCKKYLRSLRFFRA